jgi:very-short-patch-repair endonuclease/predicted transcriptional regulator of viral defense system
MRANGHPRQGKIAEIAARQHGVIALRQLLALGFGRGAIRHQVALGRLHPIYRGVFAVGHPRITQRGRWMAAVLTAGPGAVLSHVHAAALWELLPPPGSRVHVTVEARGRTPRPGIVLHQVRSLHPGDCTIRDHVPVTSLARTLLDVGEADETRLARAYEEADRRRLLDNRALTALCDRSPGRRGLKPLRALIADNTRYGPETRRELEAMFFDFCREHRLPLPACNVLVEGFLVDAFWPGSAVIVELDSWSFHRTHQAFENDRTRDATLQAAGYRVIRITYRRLVDEPEAVAAVIRKLLAA